MTNALPYSAPDDRWWRSQHPELSWEQAALNAGARRLYAARRRRASRPARRLSLPAALPAPAPRLALPPPRGWPQ